MRDYKTGGLKDVLILPVSKTTPTQNLQKSENDLGYEYVADEKISNPWYNDSTHLVRSILNPATDKSAE